MGAAMWIKNTRGKKIVMNLYFSWTVNSNKYTVLTTLSSTLFRTKKKTVKKSEIWVKFFTIGCVFYRGEDWDDPQIDPHVSLYDDFKIQFAGIVPVFLEFNGSYWRSSYDVMAAILEEHWAVLIEDSELNFHIWNANWPMKSETKMAFHGDQFWTSIFGRKNFKYISTKSNWATAYIFSPK